MKHTKEIIEEAVKNSSSVNQVLIFLGLKPAGGSHSHISNLIKKYDINICHFKRFINEGSIPKYKPEEILVKDKFKGRRTNALMLRRALIESGVKYQCVKCDNKGQWMNELLILQVDHINGDWTDNLKENLRFLCPNCHTQTNNYGRKSEHQKSGITKVICFNKKNNKCVDCDAECCQKSKRCASCQSIYRKNELKNNNCKRPLKEVLIDDLIHLKTMVSIGNKYNVSDNTVRKWVKLYEIESFYQNTMKNKMNRI